MKPWALSEATGDLHGDKVWSRIESDGSDFFFRDWILVLGPAKTIAEFFAICCPKRSFEYEQVQKWKCFQGIVDSFLVIQNQKIYTCHTA